MSATVVLSNTALTELLRSPRGPVGKDLLRRTLRVHSSARRRCPVDTGRLRSSIRFVVTSDQKGLVGIVATDVLYALYVHQGTRPHVITARSRQALYWKGARHPVASVNHPGTRAVRFLSEALPEALR